jgi:NitT/TauT family transport system substrate-binding protein
MSFSSEAIRALAVLCTAGASFAAFALEPVRIGLVRSASAAPLYIAVAAGHFKDEAVDPQLRFFATDEAVSQAAAAGQLDLGLVNLSAPFYATAAARGFKLIASQASDQTGFPMYAFLIGKKPRKAGFAARDLLNQRIGMPGIDAGPNYALFSLETRFGLDPAAIELVRLKTPALELSALSHGQIDAVLLPFPTALRSVHKGCFVLPLSDLVQWQAAAVFTTVQTIAAKRPLIERFMRAYQHGTGEYQVNFLQYDDGGDFIPGPRHDEYEAVISRQSRVPVALLAKTKTYCDRRANLDAADIQKQVKFWQDQGRLDKGIDAAALLDLSFIGEEVIH